MINVAKKNTDTLMRVSDLGGQRILGMGGSLRGYIETGNQYHSDYFTKSSDIKETINKKKEKERNDIKKFFMAVGAIGAAIAACTLLNKFTNINLKAFGGKILTNVKNSKIVQNITNSKALKTAGGFISSTAAKAKGVFSNTIGKVISNIKGKLPHKP